MEPLFISGPHGCGKTLLIKRLIERYSDVMVDDFGINFVNDLPKISKMSIYEKSLLRLYHRFYSARRAQFICANNPQKGVLIVDRSIYDSIVYNEVEYELGNLTKLQIDRLNDIAEQALQIISPKTIILNPATEGVVEYLSIRQKTKLRKKRDEICAREDTYDYLSRMKVKYENIERRTIKKIYSNDDKSCADVYRWIKQFY
ncbi:Thymidylate kinase [Pseudobutyrivibrio sp. UC1225]|uniref:AAA family ATPase n=1 Tax=Pseudobutyrivibrio sp. UC1225 TaxID=1798185 RepID=UPI0008EB428B|nr:deoxynucleoside kinase [Pseudobutyrivibrio sp. UC1225]SFO28757.1 Thymidylate kinase [Pseudobutyrivibrio sp. UC1225]